MLAVDAFILILPWLLPVVLGQATHIVTVGVEGSVYNPPTLSANVNDTVIFYFGGDIHSVTQSSLNAPCVRLPGGFDSGLTGRGPTFSNPPTVWSLRITNASEAIWFFCQASVPVSHCMQGMVGAINPPSIDAYNQFVSAAKLVTGTPKPSPSFLPSGQGAIATNSPMLSTVSSQSLSSSLSAAVSTVAVSSSPVPPSPLPTLGGSGNNRALIAGCATAGGLILLILVFVFVMVRWRAFRRASGRNSPPSKDSGPQYGHPDKTAAATSPGHGQYGYPALTPPSPPMHYGYSDDVQKYMHSEPSQSQPQSQSQSPPHTGIRPLPRTPSQKALRNVGGPDSGAEGHDDTQQADIDSLAMEVANVLLHTPPRPGSRQHLDSFRQQRESQWSDNTHAVTPPPHYRTG